MLDIRWKISDPPGHDRNGQGGREIVAGAEENAEYSEEMNAYALVLKASVRQLSTVAMVGTAGGRPEENTALTIEPVGLNFLN